MLVLRLLLLLLLLQARVGEEEVLVKEVHVMPALVVRAIVGGEEHDGIHVVLGVNERLEHVADLLAGEAAEGVLLYPVRC